MAVLLLRLHAPMQSWGSRSKFDDRLTEREPTKSGIIGLIAAAFGYRRYETDEIQKLSTALKIGILAECDGEVFYDFQMVKHSNPKKDPWISKRYYLSDASFIVGLEGEKDFLEKVSFALTHPYFPLYLGRRSCPPVGQVVLGITDKTLYEALKTYAPTDRRTRLLLESNDGYLVKDVPITFNREHREYGLRYVKSEYIGQDDTTDYFSEITGGDR
jgi:CRISPR system Cascade subunit CasD